MDKQCKKVTCRQATNQIESILYEKLSCWKIEGYPHTYFCVSDVCANVFTNARTICQTLKRNYQHIAATEDGYVYVYGSGSKKRKKCGRGGSRKRAYIRCDLLVYYFRCVANAKRSSGLLPELKDAMIQVRDEGNITFDSVEVKQQHDHNMECLQVNAEITNQLHQLSQPSLEATILDIVKFKAYSFSDTFWQDIMILHQQQKSSQ